MGQWDLGLSDGKGNIYLAGIKHCMLALLIRNVTHKFIIQNRGRRGVRREMFCICHYFAVIS